MVTTLSISTSGPQMVTALVSTCTATRSGCPELPQGGQKIRVICVVPERQHDFPGLTSSWRSEEHRHIRYTSGGRLIGDLRCPCA